MARRRPARPPAMVSDRRWDEAYERLGAGGVSWRQAVPGVSPELIALICPTLDEAVIDVGGGMATLVDYLLARGADDVSVLDLSQTAVQASATRLGSDGERVDWICGDVLEWNPPRRYGIWRG